MDVLWRLMRGEVFRFFNKSVVGFIRGILNTFMPYFPSPPPKISKWEIPVSFRLNNAHERMPSHSDTCFANARSKRGTS